jgi:hypothetical protein
MELFEEYFSNYNKAINAENARTAGNDYAEVEGPLAETVEGFLVTNFLAHLGGNKYSIPSLTTTGSTAYYILKMLCHTKEITSGTNDVVGLNVLKSATGQFTTFGITEGDIVVNTVTDAVSNVVTVVSNTTIILTSDIFLVSGQGYKIISQEEKEADKVSVGKITMLNASSLTSPTEFYPSYIWEGERITLFPNTINDKGKVKAVYFRHPKVPKWTYFTLLSGEPMFDQTQPDYEDFELPVEDTYRLVMKILQYCGMSIREMEVANFGMVQEQQNNQQ